MYRIGLDLDNTLINYDHVFCEAGSALGFLPEEFNGSKQSVRAFIELSDNGEVSWQRLQGEVYGFRINDARLMQGVSDFLKKFAYRKDTELFIISHKTKRGHFHADGLNLRQIAIGWLQNQGFFASNGFRFTKEHIYFEDTLDKKIQRIGNLQCTYFVDDLVEVFQHRNFPTDTVRILFTNGKTYRQNISFKVCCTWDEISDFIGTSI